MELLLNFEPWWRFAVALLIGAMIGLEREFVRQRSEDPEFAGIRTFSLMALLGAISAHFSQQFGILLFIIAYIGLALGLPGAAWMHQIGGGWAAGMITLTGTGVSLVGVLLGDTLQGVRVRPDGAPEIDESPEARTEG